MPTASARAPQSAFADGRGLVLVVVVVMWRLLAGEGASLPALGAAEAAAAPEAELAKPEKADEEDSYGGKRDLLETCDDLAYRSIGLGFAFLTIGIISGAVWANEAWGSYWR